MLTPRPPLRIAILAFPEVELLDVAGPAEVFAMAAGFHAASHAGTERLYGVEVINAVDDRAIRTSSGLSMHAGKWYREVLDGIDTLLVAGGPSSGLDAAARDRHLLEWLVMMSRKARRIGSVCTGAFLLAEAGLLRKRKATTHWSRCEALQLRYPAVDVDAEVLYTVDGSIYTSAGVTAGMDLALALVEADAGTQLAAEVARELVLYMRRPAGQPQLSGVIARQAADRHPIRGMQTWIADNLQSDLSVETLAAHAAMSARHFTRLFLAETQMTPARYVEQLRVEAACRRLEESGESVERIASQCGFGSVDAMRRAFLRLRSMTPRQYRNERGAR